MMQSSSYSIPFAERHPQMGFAAAENPFEIGDDLLCRAGGLLGRGGIFLEPGVGIFQLFDTGAIGLQLRANRLQGFLGVGQALFRRVGGGGQGVMIGGGALYLRLKVGRAGLKACDFGIGLGQGVAQMTGPLLSRVESLGA